MKKMILLSVFTLTICVTGYAQAYIYHGDNRYESTYSWEFLTNGDFPNQNPEFTIAKHSNGGYLMISIKDPLKSKISGNVILFLSDGTTIKCSDKGIRDYVDNKSIALYNLTKLEIEKLKQNRIETVRYTIGSDTYTANNRRHADFGTMSRPYDSTYKNYYETEAEVASLFSSGTAGKSISPAHTFTCGSFITIKHLAGAVSPVNKTVTYGTVTNIPGENSKCWITSNLGADHQTNAAADDTQAWEGWYWQFNRKQGYISEGVIQKPKTPCWVNEFTENSDWTTANDPCAIELRNGWRIPTRIEWSNVNASGNWKDRDGPGNSALKLHPAGYLNCWNSYRWNGRSSHGYYWSSMQSHNTSLNPYGWSLYFDGWYSEVREDYKANCASIRCIRED